MKVTNAIYIIFIFSALCFGEGPIKKQQDTNIQQEFDNVYQDLRSIASSKINGTGTNDDAPVGKIGEYKEATIETPTSYPGATNAWSDATSMTLAPGDWDVYFSLINSEAGGSQTTQFQIGISTVTGNSSSTLIFGVNALRSPSLTSNDGSSVVVGSYRKKLASNTMIFGKLLGTYTVATPTYRCRLSARRMR